MTCLHIAETEYNKYNKAKNIWRCPECLTDECVCEYMSYIRRKTD